MNGSTASFTGIAMRLGPPIDAALDARTRLGNDCPARLREAMRYSLLAPGKRLRPMLALLAAETCGGSLEAAMPAACAVEMVHAYSLIHDDLPAMDDDDLRRGRPTCHKAFDEATAILAGDALLTLAFEVLANEIEPKATAAACCAALARAAGACGMVGGQADDVKEGMKKTEGGQRQGEEAILPSPFGKETGSEGGVAPEDRSALTLALSQSERGAFESIPLSPSAFPLLESIHRRKTGAMICVSLQLGAMTAGAAEEQLLALRTYGECLGLAFQITDDLLDVQSSEAAMGKRVGKDANRGKLTFPGLIGLDQSAQYARQWISTACESLNPFGTAAEGLRAVAQYVLERNR